MQYYLQGLSYQAHFITAHDREQWKLMENSDPDS